MSQIGNITNSSPNGEAIKYGYDPTFETTENDGVCLDHHSSGDLFAKQMSEEHESKDYEPVIGSTREEVEEYVHFTLPKNRHGHKHLFYEILESSAEYGYSRVYKDIVDGYGCTDMSADYDTADKSQFEPIIGFEKE